MWISPNLDLKQGIGSKAVNFFAGKRKGEGRERETEIEGKDRNIEGRDREKGRQSNRVWILQIKWI